MKGKKPNTRSELKNKGISQQQQGEAARSRGGSDARMVPMPRSMERGIGSSFAYAVASVMDQAKHAKGSDRDSWLGEKKMDVDPKEFAHSLLKKKSK
jgi:hypothetical protein